MRELCFQASPKCLQKDRCLDGSGRRSRECCEEGKWYLHLLCCSSEVIRRRYGICWPREWWSWQFKDATATLKSVWKMESTRLKYLRHKENDLEQVTQKVKLRYQN